jgi:hypothetical protein
MSDTPNKKYMDMAFDILDDADLYELQKSIAARIESEAQRLQAENTRLREDIEIIERKLGEGWIAELAISLAPQEKE